MKLKFESVNGYGVLVDDNHNIEYGWHFSPKDGIIMQEIVNIDDSNIETTKESIRIFGTKWYPILFAEKELELEGVPVFEWREKDVVQENLEGICSWDAYKDHPIGRKAKNALDAYKSNPAKYTEEDLEVVIRTALYFWTTSNKSESEAVKTIIKSLQKYPKYVVMESETQWFNEGKGWQPFPDHKTTTRKKLPKLFINSQVMLQGVVQELIWE